MNDSAPHITLAQRLAENPDGVLERIAEEHGVSLLLATEALPKAHRTIIDGQLFESVMEDITTWGEILFIVHTKGIVLECKGALPPGSSARGYYNIHGDSPIGGHIKAERCRRIAFVSRPFMGRASCSVQFFDVDGEAMFKIFVRRDADRNLLPAQVALFGKLRDRLASVE